MFVCLFLAKALVKALKDFEEYLAPVMFGDCALVFIGVKQNGDRTYLRVLLELRKSSHNFRGT